uniref:Uncharacterized protein n=1 Tax=Anguilla anguilla TaxID=7936 RepID=A0A0E9VYL3_ANGAN
MAMGDKMEEPLRWNSPSQESRRQPAGGYEAL